MSLEIYMDTHFFGFGISWGEWDEYLSEHFICIDLPFISFRIIFA